jgi:luciferase family oxidoreductase group 1
VVPGVDAVPGNGSRVPLYILGSSLFGARLAAALGLPYAFASHFAPAALDAALAAYRSEFQPSDQLERPYVIAGVNVIAADTTSAAERQLQDIRRRRAVSLYGRQIGVRDLEMSDEQADQLLAAGAAAHVDEMLTYTALGTPRQVQEYLDGFLRRTEADELMVTHQAPSIEDRLRSIVLLGEAMLDLSTT